MLTKEQKEKYLKAAGLRCPFCGSDNISGWGFEADGTDAWREIVCLQESCKKTWHDVYKLIDCE